MFLYNAEKEEKKSQADPRVTLKSVTVYQFDLTNLSI